MGGIELSAQALVICWVGFDDAKEAVRADVRGGKEKALCPAAARAAVAAPCLPETALGRSWARPTKPHFAHVASLAMVGLVIEDDDLFHKGMRRRSEANGGRYFAQHQTISLPQRLHCRHPQQTLDNIRGLCPGATTATDSA
jgi:hypothetical protein